VWVGNDDETPMKAVTGGNLPARIWRDFMSAALAAPEDSAPGPDAVVAGTAADGEATAACNFRVCARSYRSFRASDCTFQPYSGPRRLCEK
jgi:penicillin-binding protein 1A